MESTGTIIKILPAVSGTSARTGNPWMSQQFVIEVRTGEHGQYTKKQVYELFGEDKIKQANLVEGATVKVSFDIEAREFEGKWYNSLRAWNVSHIAQTQGQVVQQPQQRPQQRQQYPQQQNVGYFQPTNQYPQQGGYYQPQQGYPQGGYPPQQQYAPQPQYPPQQPYPPQHGGAGGAQEDLPF